MLLFRKIEEIKKNSPSMKVLYLNTDAIMIEIPTNIPLPFTISSRTGDWKHQIKNCKMITKFVALKPSCNHLTYLDFEDKLLQVNKISGFSLESAIAGDFDIGKFENLLYSAIHEKKSNKKENVDWNVLQMRKFNTDRYSFIHKKCLFSLRNSLDRTRLCNKDFTTRSFGYKKTHI